MKNFINFLVFNRFSVIILCWVLGFIFIITNVNPYINFYILIFLFLGTLFYATYIIEECEMNDNEKKLFNFLKKIF